ncbi:MAG: histidine kinase [Bacteroidetes bacterium]|nr:histidine kinase [Bacteroidota bacterium]
MDTHKKIFRRIVTSRWVQHLAFWGFSFLVLLNYFRLSSQAEPIDYLYTAFFHISLIIGVYINLRLLIPVFLKRKKIILFAVFFAINLLVVSQLNIFIFDYLIDKLFPGYYFISYYDFTDILQFHIVYLVLSSLLKLSKEWFELLESQTRLAQIEQEKTHTELKALRSQVNPHFLFNSLNNIYSLSLKKADETPQVILALSDMFRYIIYETGEDLIELTKEVAFLEKYIELQQIRSDQKANITFEVKGDPSAIKVAPLIFLPFLENSFKHGIKGDTAGGYVHLRIDIDQDIIHFQLSNNKGKGDEIGKEKKSGIGLENVRRRLELEYSGNHSLDIKESEDEFSVSLKLTKR